jgi:hypothetical protein
MEYDRSSLENIVGCRAAAIMKPVSGAPIGDAKLAD